MAPSSKTRTQHTRSQAPVFRVTKSSRLNERPVSHLKQKIDAIEEVISENAPPVQAPKVVPAQTPTEPATQHAKKRRRDSDVNNEADAETDTFKKHATKRSKKTAVSSLSTASPSPKTRTQQDDTEDIPEVLQVLRQLHKYLLHALSVHYAHTKGGVRDVVDLAALLPTMTRLWRKKTVQVQDVQRVLALWELPAATRTETAPGSGDSSGSEDVAHARGPFRMEQIGLGATGAVTLEYTWTDADTVTDTRAAAFIDTDLQRRYEARVFQLSASPLYRDAADGLFTWKCLADVPKLQFEMGMITQLRREKVASIRSHILSKAATTTTTTTTLATTAASAPSSTPALQQPDLSRLSIHGPPSSPPRKSQSNENNGNTTINATAKSRTLGLFDRVRAKQQLSAAATALTPAQQLRQRALQRIPELVDVLRLKQARKLITGGQEMQMQTQTMKVSFSFETLVQEIRDSLRSEVAGDEIREGIIILGRDVPGEWCRVYEVGSVRCVTLQGEAVARKDVEGWCKLERARAVGLNV